MCIRDSRDAVHREDHVGHADQHQHHEQRGEPARTVLADAQLVAAIAIGELQVPAHPAQRRILFQIRLLAGGEPHLDAGQQQERAEEVQQPVEVLQQCRAGEDQDAAQDDGAQDADDQHALALFLGHGEVGHHHQEHEDVVDRQRLLCLLYTSRCV